MDQGPALNAIKEQIPPKYGWDTLGESSSEDEAEKHCDDLEKDGIQDFISPVRSLDWDNYSSPPSFSSNPLEKVLSFPSEEVLEEEVFEDPSGDADLNPVRRSNRVRKPYPYRGIGDYVSWKESDEEEDWRKQSRTLTESSNLDEVLLKGDHSKSRRKILRSREPAEITLPSSFVHNFTDVLITTRPIVPELVQPDRCLRLDLALQHLPPQVLLPQDQDLVEVRGGGGDDGGTEDGGGGPPEEGGVRQFHL